MSGESLIGGWLNDLAGMLGGKPLIDAELRDKVTAMTGMLARKAHPDWFTADSLEFCLRRFKFFPGYADLWARLQLFQREQSKQLVLAAPPDIPYADNPRLSDADRHWCKGWQKQRHEGAEADRVRFLDTLRRYSSAAFEVLCVDCEIARDIARRKGWISRPPATAEEQIAISKTVASIAHGFHVPREPVQAPLASVPSVAGASEDFTAAFQARHGRKPGTLTPDSLHEARLQVPGLKEIAERGGKSPTEPVDKVPDESAPAPPKRRKGAGGAREALPWH
jgi:hypothetical protein